MSYSEHFWSGGHGDPPVHHAYVQTVLSLRQVVSVTGTRITVELILQALAAGDTIPELLLEYPQLTKESIQAALAYAAEALRADVVYPTPESVSQ